MKNKKAFTLIELLVVVLIIGILAAVAFPQYQLAVDKSRVKSVFPVMRAVVNAEKLYRLEHGSYTTNWEELDVDISHTRLSDTKTLLYLAQGGSYLLSCEGTYCHVTFYAKGNWVSIYAAFPKELWICYPGGTTRGKAICKNLA